MSRGSLHPYLVATIWAIMLVLSSWLFRGTHAGDWVDAALYIAAGVWLTSTMQRPRVR